MHLKRIPIVAEVHGHGRLIESEFDVAPYFYKELREGDLRQALIALEDCQFCGDYPADAVAEFFPKNETRPIFKCLAVKGGFECSIDKATVITWLAGFAPQYRSVVE